MNGPADVAIVAAIVAAAIVAAGSAIGGMARYALVVAIETRRGDSRWPLGTLAVNLLGCFLMGVVLSTSMFAAMDALRLGLIAALGSFTTVSAFVLESWQRRTHRATWIGYAAVTLLGSLLMFRLGQALA